MADIKLSAAIRLGCRDTIPADRVLLGWRMMNSYTNAMQLVACALGAGWHGLYPNAEKCQYCEIEEVYPELLKPALPPKGIECRATDLEGIIIELNDSEGWSREHIADWVESIGY